MLDLLLRNGVVLTMDPDRPRANVLGIWNGRIVGVDEEVEGLRAARSIDLQGSTVMPGFHDAHCHTTSFGVAASQLDVSDAPTTDSVLARVRDHAATLPPGAWVVGVGYLDRGDAGRHPTRDELDHAGAGRPVWLTHRSGHMCSVSTAVLRLLPDPLPPEAARYLQRDGAGRPTGLLEEAAMELVKAVVGPGSVRDMVRAIDLATSAYVSEGITSFTEAGVGCPGVDHSPIELAAWQTARREQRLHARAQLMVYSELLHALPGHETDEAKLGLDLGVHTGFGDGWLRLGAMKLWIDGAGTAGQAATSTPSGKATDSDPDADSGFVDDPRRMSGMIIAAHRAGWQVAAHAMGDRAVDLLLAALEQAGPEAEVRGRRHRIEHAGLVRPDQIEQIRRLGVVVAIQPPFIPEFGDTLAQHFGADRVSWSIRCRSLTEAGVVVAASSDRPVAPGPPLQGVQTMVERLTASGALYGEHERVTATEALRAYTWSGAFAAHSEGDVGKVTARNLADLVVLEDDPTTVDPSDIAGIQIVATVVDGRAVHDPGRLFPAHRSDDGDRA